MSCLTHDTTPQCQELGPTEEHYARRALTRLQVLMGVSPDPTSLLDTLPRCAATVGWGSAPATLRLLYWHNPWTRDDGGRCRDAP